MTRVKLTDNSDDSGFGEKIGTGVFVNIGLITSLEDYSNYPGKEPIKTYGTKGFVPELCLEIKFKVDDFDRQLSVFGKFKKNKKGAIISWDPWQNTVQRLLYKVLADEAEIDTDTMEVPYDVLHKLIGKEFKYVSYQSNRTYDSDDGVKYSYGIWNKTFSINDPKETIEKEWIDNLSYIHDYAPEIAEQKGKSAASFNPSEFESNTESSESSEGLI